MIKIKQVYTEHGEGYLTVEYDVEGRLKQVTISLGDVAEKLRELKAIVGRKLTVQDLKDVVKTLIDKHREGQAVLLEKFDFSPLIDVDLEEAQP